MALWYYKFCQESQWHNRIFANFVLDSIKDLNFRWSSGICLASNLITLVNSGNASLYPKLSSYRRQKLLGVKREKILIFLDNFFIELASKIIE